MCYQVDANIISRLLIDSYKGMEQSTISPTQDINLYSLQHETPTYYSISHDEKIDHKFRRLVQDRN